MFLDFDVTKQILKFVFYVTIAFRIGNSVSDPSIELALVTNSDDRI